MSKTNNDRQTNSSSENANVKQTKNTQEKASTHSLENHNSSSATTTTETQNPDWFALARKLRQYNRQLAKNVVKLEQSLAETQEKLQAQVIKARSADVLVAQQNEELNLAQEQVTRLLKELEDAHQVVKEQQVLIDDLSLQLETSQERVAYLERECAFQQESYNTKSQKLLSSEQQVRELTARLIRQQRYNLQFKAALDQCLDTPNYVSPLPDSHKPLSSTKSIISPVSPIPKVQSIKPWSSDLEAWENSENDQSIKNHISSSGETKNIATEEKVQEHQPTKIEFPPKLATVELDSQTSLTDEHQFTSPQDNWPSPIIQSMRTTKKLKSKSEIDLPTFPPMS